MGQKTLDEMRLDLCEAFNSMIQRGKNYHEKDMKWDSRDYAVTAAQCIAAASKTAQAIVAIDRQRFEEKKSKPFPLDGKK